MTYQITQSEQLFKDAQKHIPGGVNSPVRAFKGVGGTHVFFDHAKGAYAFDADGNKYIDYVGSWGPMILGHNADTVMDAIKAQMEKGLSFGAPTDRKSTRLNSSHVRISYAVFCLKKKKKKK